METPFCPKRPSIQPDGHGKLRLRAGVFWLKRKSNGPESARLTVKDLFSYQADFKDDFGRYNTEQDAADAVDAFWEAVNAHGVEKGQLAAKVPPFQKTAPPSNLS